MKKSYSVLKTIASLNIVIGYIILGIGVLLSLFFFNYYLGNSNLLYAIAVAIAVVIGSLISATPFWAAGQFIRLCVNVADDISTMSNNINIMSDNVYFIADNLNMRHNNTN